MKKLFATLLLLAALTFTACGTDGYVINVANWGLFIDEAVLEMFEQEYGITVIYSTYSTNEDLYTMITRSGAEFDVIVPSDYMVERMINEGLLARLNWDNIPNARYIDDRFKNLAFDPENLYSVPYKWGTFGIVYNTTKVDQVVDSWRILWDEQFAGEIFMYDSSRCTIGAVQRMLGFSMNSRDLNQLHEARDMLIQQAPLVRAFLADQIIDNMIGGEGALGTVYNGCARWIIYYNPDHNFAIPQEGTQLWFNSMVVPATTQNQDHAEKFINFMCDTEVAKANIKYINYSTPLKSVYNALPADVKNNKIIYPDKKDLERCETFLNLSKDTNQLLESLWTKILTS